MIVRSSAKAKFHFMANEICGLLWFMKLLDELGFLVKGPINIFCDNKVAISISQYPVKHDRTKHVEIDQHFIKDHIKSGCIYILFVTTKFQFADIFTKGYVVFIFSCIVDNLGMTNIYSLA